MTSLEKIKIDLKPIKDGRQYQDYLKIIDSLIDCLEDSPEEETLELVSILVEDYEEKHYHIEAPDPIEAIKLKIEESGLRKRDLAAYFGSPSRVSEVLNRKRPLSLEMIRRLHDGLGISLETLISGRI